MTPSDTYRAILLDVRHLFDDRAYRYFAARQQDVPNAEQYQLQCDLLMMVMTQYLEPHTAWFREWDETQKVLGVGEFVTVELEPSVPGEDAHGDASHNG